MREYLQAKGHVVCLAILGEPLGSDALNYRGTDRNIPHYVEALAEAHPTNQLWFEYVDTAPHDFESELDLHLARRVVAAYAALEPPQHFEIVELIVGEHAPIHGTTCLGYDVTDSMNYSFISDGLRHWRNRPPDDDPLVVICQLMGAFFTPLLNAHGLFDSHEQATFCMECILAAQSFDRPYFEGGPEHDVVVGIWLVDGHIDEE